MFKLQHNLVMSLGEMQFSNFQYFSLPALPADSLKEDNNHVSILAHIYKPPLLKLQYILP